MTGNNPDRRPSCLGSLYFSGQNRKEACWSHYAPRNSAALTAKESGERSMLGKGIYKSVRQKTTYEENGQRACFIITDEEKGSDHLTAGCGPLSWSVLHSVPVPPAAS